MAESLKIKTAPSVEPVTTDELKDQLKIIGNAEDSYLALLIKAAREVVEKLLQRAVINQSWYYILDNSPSRIYLPYPPLQSVTSITSYDDDNSSTINSSGDYTVITNTDPGQILLKPGCAWDYHREFAGFWIEYVAGYGSAATSVPDMIKHGIKVLATKLYQRRGDDINALLMESDVMRWLSPYINVGL